MLEVAVPLISRSICQKKEVNCSRPQLQQRCFTIQIH